MKNLNINDLSDIAIEYEHSNRQKINKSIRPQVTTLIEDNKTTTDNYAMGLISESEFVIQMRYNNELFTKRIKAAANDANLDITRLLK